MIFRIKEVRRAKGITQEELSRRSKVSRAILWGLESGKRTVTTTTTLLKIAEALGCTVDELFTDSDREAAV